jgi:Tfp pilus assembly protein FimT
MKRRDTLDGNPSSHRHFAGFTLVEILIVIAMGFIIMAIAIPYGLSAYRTYELDSAAMQVASSLKFTRMEAIRLNTPIDFRSQVLANGNTQIWTDSNGPPYNDGIVQATENQAVLTASGNVVAIGGVPNTAAIAAAIGGPALTGVPAAGGLITFDQRGAVVNPVVAVYAICIQNTSVPTAGYRAIVVLPSGAIQMWAAGAGGNWHQTS